MFQFELDREMLVVITKMQWRELSGKQYFFKYSDEYLVKTDTILQKK